MSIALLFITQQLKIVASILCKLEHHLSNEPDCDIFLDLPLKSLIKSISRLNNKIDWLKCKLLYCASLCSRFSEFRVSCNRNKNSSQKSLENCFGLKRRNFHMNPNPHEYLSETKSRRKKIIVLCFEVRYNLALGLRDSPSTKGLMEW